MPFSVCNAPSTLQEMIKALLRELLEEGVIAYIDNIVINFDLESEHTGLVRKVLPQLREAKVSVSIKMSSFQVTGVGYIAYLISAKRITMSLNKVNANGKWPVTSNVKGVQEFLGLANFYRRFVEVFSRICHPLTVDLRKSMKFVLTPACHKSSELVKEVFSSAPILAHFNPDATTRVEPHASNFAKSVVLSQLHSSDKKWHPVTFYSQKFT